MITVERSYNLTSEDLDELAKGNWQNFFNYYKRNSLFGCILYDKDLGKYYLIRDHIGNTPLFYGFNNNKFQASFYLKDVCGDVRRYKKEGLKAFLYYGTAKIEPLFEGVFVVPPGCVLSVDENTGATELLFSYKINSAQLSERTEVEVIYKTEQLLRQAVQRLLGDSKEVGLLLSGGMDSGLIAQYIAQSGVGIKAYTCSPWGPKGTEVAYARTNAAAIKTLISHRIIPMEYEKYEEYYQEALRLYPNPHGTTTALGISAMCSETDVLKNDKVFFAQNADTVLSAMMHQYSVYFLHHLPIFLQKKIHPTLGYKEILDDYLSFVTKGVITKPPTWFATEGYTSVQLMAIAGMTLGHTPSDGEVLFYPLMKEDIFSANPYYDMDFIEYCLSIPLRYRIGFSHESKIFISFEKRILRKLAVKYLPEQLVYRKKGFAGPELKKTSSIDFFAECPKEFFGIQLSENQSRFAARMLRDFFKDASL